jgi:hypothetical protein
MSRANFACFAVKAFGSGWNRAREERKEKRKYAIIAAL